MFVHVCACVQYTMIILQIVAIIVDWYRKKITKLNRMSSSVAWCRLVRCGGMWCSLVWCAVAWCAHDVVWHVVVRFNAR